MPVLLVKVYLPLALVYTYVSTLACVFIGKKKAKIFGLHLHCISDAVMQHACRLLPAA
jgi:hypothetical protein